LTSCPTPAPCAWPILQKNQRIGFAVPPYVWRSYEKSQSTRLCPGKVDTFKTVGDYPAVGPYIMLVNFKGWRTRLLSGDFLAPAGPHNDAANEALSILAGAGALEPSAFALLPFRDAWPLCHGYTYTRLGIHLMFARDLDADPGTLIGWPDCREPLTAGAHLENCRRLV
jgi:hypothetical protein